MGETISFKFLFNSNQGHSEKKHVQIHKQGNQGGKEQQEPACCS